MVHMAARHPEVALIGADPFVNGVAMLLGRIRAAGLRNLAVHPGDVRDLFDVLPDGSISLVFLNYPDPWPKARHHRRPAPDRG
jgi:tRNA (guanine-N7-)-methyltransferase